MAAKSAGSLADTLVQSDTLEQVPDSSPLGLSLKTEFESGIPPARVRHELSLEDGLEHMDSTLASVTRTEANLSLLVRGLKHLGAGALAAREANTELMNELEELRVYLSRSQEEEQALRFRMVQIERLLDAIRHESARERAFLIEQQDLFLVELMSDHDRQIADLHRQLTRGSLRSENQSNSEGDKDALITELKAQRDQARDYATRCERERDAAWHELATGEERPGPSSVSAETVRRPVAPPPPLPTEPSGSKSGALAIGSINLRAVKVPVSSIPGTEHAAERPTTAYSVPGKDLEE